MTDVLEYLDSKSFDYRRDGNEVIIKCPHCNKNKLYINSINGKFHCFHCEAVDQSSPYAKGHISQLQEMWGDIIPIKSVSDRIIPEKNRQEVDFTQLMERYHFEIFKNKKAIRYLAQRGITEKSIHRFKLGFTRRYNQDWLVIPSFEDNIPKLLKLRKLEPDENAELDKYIREKDSKSILFNGDILDKFEEIIIAEGELDAIALIQYGYENTIGITGGAKTLLPEWYDNLFCKEKLLLCLDPDEAGQLSARDVWATRLGLSKCWNIKLPDGYDANSFLVKYGKEPFDKLIEDSSTFKVEGILSLTEALYELYNQSKDEEGIRKYPLPWDSINRLLDGGLQRKRLTVLGGQPGSGKTSLSIQVAYHFAHKYKLPSLVFCLEMPETALAVKVVQLSKDLTYQEINPSDALIYAQDLEDIPLYFGYAPRIKPEIVYNTTREARNRYGIGFVIFDNLQLLVRTDKESDIANASKMFKMISMDLNMMVMLVSQPRKLNSEENPTYDDLKGSSAIPADADEIILIHRRREKDENGTNSFESMTSVIIDKSRFSSGGRTRLNFIGEKSRFEEWKDN